MPASEGTARASNLILRQDASAIRRPKTSAQADALGETARTQERALPAHQARPPQTKGVERFISAYVIYILDICL